MRIAASHIDVSRVVPALRAVLEQIDGAYRKGLALNNGVRATGRQLRVRHESERLERPPRPERPGPGRVLLSSALAAGEAARAEIADFQGSIFAKAFLYRGVVLLYVLGGRMRIECREADGGGWQRAGTQHRRTEVQSRVEQRRWRSEVVCLLSFRKNEGHIVPLVTPRVLIDGREENAIRRVKYETPIG